MKGYLFEKQRALGVEGVVTCVTYKGRRDVSTNTINVNRFFKQSLPSRRQLWDIARQQWQLPGQISQASSQTEQFTEN